MSFPQTCPIPPNVSTSTSKNCKTCLVVKRRHLYKCPNVSIHPNMSISSIFFYWNYHSCVYYKYVGYVVIVFYYCILILRSFTISLKDKKINHFMPFSLSIKSFVAFTFYNVPSVVFWKATFFLNFSNFYFKQYLYHNRN